jgi:hypothetical protein
MSERRKVQNTRGISAKRSTASRDLDFASLVDAIRQVHQRSAAAASRAVNAALTLRCSKLVLNHLHLCSADGLLRKVVEHILYRNHMINS